IRRKTQRLNHAGTERHRMSLRRSLVARVERLASRDGLDAVALRAIPGELDEHPRVTHLRLPLPDSDSAVMPVDHRRGDDDAVLTQRGSYRVRDGIDAAEHEAAARGVVPFALTYRLHVSHHAVECLVDGCHDTFFGR